LTRYLPAKHIAAINARMAIIAIRKPGGCEYFYKNA